MRIRGTPKLSTCLCLIPRHTYTVQEAFFRHDDLLLSQGKFPGRQLGPQRTLFQVGAANGMDPVVKHFPTGVDICRQGDRHQTVSPSPPRFRW